MKGFERDNQWLSLCGLNCGLCLMRVGGYCPGCGGGEGNQSCKIAKCALRREKVEYCFQCEEYPCEIYRLPSLYDTFLPCQNRMGDLEKAKTMGIEAYNAQQERKAAHLQNLLAHYNDGKRKTMFCVAANLLDLEKLDRIAEQLAECGETLPIKERAAFAAALLTDAAAEQGISLKLRRKKT